MTATAEQRVDTYPTRNDGEVQVFPREDAVVQGTAADGPMDQRTLDGFEAAGYLMIDQVITQDELQEFNHEMDRLSRDPKVREDERCIIESASNEVRSIFEVHTISDVFRRIANDPRVVGRAKQLLGSDVYIHQSRVNFKPGFEGKEFMWHSDFETWHAEDGMPAPRAVSISISLTDNYSYNGPLMIMPGTHKEFVSCDGATPEDNYKKSLMMQGVGTPDKGVLRDFADKYGIDVLEGPAGGAIMFDSNCMHASNGNVTPYSRSNIFIVFNSVENTVEEPYAAPQVRPEFIRATDFTPAGS